MRSAPPPRIHKADSSPGAAWGRERRRPIPTCRWLGLAAWRTGARGEGGSSTYADGAAEEAASFLRGGALRSRSRSVTNQQAINKQSISYEALAICIQYVCLL